MSRRFRPTDAFVDESIRGQRYLMGCVLIEARQLTATRAAIGALPTRGRRLHFNNEVDAQKRILLASIAELPVRAFVAVCHRRHGITEFVAREACLAALVSEVQSQRVDRLVLESRQDDSEDARIISKLRQPEPPLVFEHRTAGVKPCWASPTESRGWPVQERTGRHSSSRSCSECELRPQRRRTRFPHLRVGNRVHFQGPLPEAGPVCTKGVPFASRFALATMISEIQQLVIARAISGLRTE